MLLVPHRWDVPPHPPPLPFETNSQSSRSWKQPTDLILLFLVCEGMAKGHDTMPAQGPAPCVHADAQGCT